ncbi:MAG: ABC transporter permease subunit [Devosia sp.]
MTGLDAVLADIVTLSGPALTNIYFAVASIPAGFGLGILLALGKASANPLVSRLCRGYIYFFRGSPFFIQLFAFYSLALAFNLSLWKPLGIDGFVLHPLFLGPAILTLNTAAYDAEIFHGAMRAVPHGELEAARAFGMSPAQRFRSIIWPHMIRIAWPGYTNELVLLFQATALIYFTLPVVGDQKDLMNKAGEMFERDYNVFLHFGVAALYFFAVSLLIFALCGLIYRRLMRHLPHQTLRFSFRRIGDL